MKILVVGSGAREHVIGEKVKENPNVDEIFFAPGNGGTSALGKNVEIQSEDINSLVEFSKKEKIDFTIVGPEGPLTLGIVDAFEKEGLKIFGPNKNAAQLEGSKSFAKEFMINHNIPTGNYIKSEDYDNSLKFAKMLLDNNGKAVIKADGLCAGKGVFIVNNEKDASKYLKNILVDGNYGEKRVVIEEFLEGFEMSLIAFVDNNTIKPLPTSKDHKNIYNGDLGPNTGGMGTYSPNLQGSPYLEEINQTILVPFLEGLKKDNLDFRGIIFIGLMIGDNGIKVLEFNTRFGDPEAQSILNRIDNDLLEIMEKTYENKLSDIEIIENDKKVVTLVLASGGYPMDYEKGFEIKGLEDVSDVKVYHGGTSQSDGKILTSGGRVLSVVAIEDSFEEARLKAYEESEKIEFKNKYFRDDIGFLVNRYYTEKDSKLFNENKNLRENIKKDLGFDPGKIRILDRFDIEGLTSEEGDIVSKKILCDSQIEKCFRNEEAFELEKTLVNPLVVEFQEGQFNEKEYATVKNIQFLTGREDILVNTALVYSFDEILEGNKKSKIEEYIINYTNQQKGKLLGLPTTLKIVENNNKKNEIFNGFIDLEEEGLKEFLDSKSLSMSLEDLKFVQEYFKAENRDINETELYILDTYWSDHCRHTTFNTILNVKIKNSDSKLDSKIQREFDEYIKMRKDLDRTKPVSLMDLGTIVAKYLKTTGDLDNVENSDEVNACSIEIEIKVEDRITKEIKTEEFLLMFKNETHNHPTEIEPYGGAHTCIGGGIRDPLSGRAYVYQAMRITGAADPRVDYDKTIKGKLPQKRIAIEASDGYSTYGNEIGLAGGLVDEIYHDGFLAKRMELGALVGAQKKEYVTRESAKEGDVILLLGAKTGRDGIGAATGSSGEQEENIIESSSPEVQRGNPPLERNIIRLFRNSEATKLIKKSNDFGAGGVSVAIGELADSLDIYLDRVPLKYPGLSPKEIAIAESQERMAVVIDNSNKDKFIKLCLEEDIETTEVAVVTNTNKMRMYFNDELVCQLDRDFLDASGVDRYQDVVVGTDEETNYFAHKGNEIEDIYTKLDDLNYVSKKNLYSKFDFTIGRSTVLAPLGGENLLTPVQSMVGIIPTLSGNSKTASIMSYGYDPFLSEENQFLGGYYAVIESLVKLGAVGGNPFKARLSFQEFFESLGDDESKWAKPLKSLLGAFYACRELKVAPIGGKDSMSGTFKDINVPPTLISFGVTYEDVENIISPELKGGNKIGIIETSLEEDNTLNHEELKENLKNLYENIKSKNITSAYALTYKGVLHNLLEMSVGNGVGFIVDFDRPFDNLTGSILVEYKDSRDFIKPIGLSGGDTYMINSEKLDMDRFLDKYENSLDEIYPKVEEYKNNIGINRKTEKREFPELKLDKVKGLIPIFPGTTGEYDVEELLLKEQVDTTKLVFRMDKVEYFEDSIEKLSKEIKETNILILPSGMVNGDEPNGSGKLISTILLNDKIKEAVNTLLDNNGLILGIGSGFQGLLRTGLLPYGKYTEDKENPLLIKNESNSYISTLVNVNYLTNNSPWLQDIEVEEDYLTPLSTAYGRLILSREMYRSLAKNEQIVSVFSKNITGSSYAIEGLMSPDGRIIGKVTNFDRIKEDTLINTLEKLEQNLIKSAVESFRK